MLCCPFQKWAAEAVQLQSLCIWHRLCYEHLAKCLERRALENKDDGHVQGLKVQEGIVNMSRIFVDGIKQAGLSEEQMERIWMGVLSPVAAELFQAHMDDMRAEVIGS